MLFCYKLLFPRIPRCGSFCQQFSYPFISGILKCSKQGWLFFWNVIAYAMQPCSVATKLMHKYFAKYHVHDGTFLLVFFKLYIIVKYHFAGYKRVAEMPFWHCSHLAPWQLLTFWCHLLHCHCPCLHNSLSCSVHARNGCASHNGHWPE